MPRAPVLIALLLAGPVFAQEDRAVDPELAALSVARWLGAVEADPSEDNRQTLLVALELAGEAGERVLVERLEAAGDDPRAAAACWAVGERFRPQGLDPAGSPLRARAVAALRGALASPSPDLRLAAASAAGLLEARAAEPELLDLTLSPGLTPAAEDVLLLALAGLRGSASSLLEARLERGGGETWSQATTLSFLRWGGDGWPLLLRHADADDPTVRATALTTLLLLAEPESACGLAELYGGEPERVLRRLILQALAATRHPLAVDTLKLLSREEPDPQLRETARLLSAGLARERERRREAGTEGSQRSVPELLAELERGAGFTRQVDEIELRADPVHAAMIAATLRRLVLRDDERRLDDHARLAQVRARLLCLDGLDCSQD